VLYSVDSTAGQQPASLKLQDVEDTGNDWTFTWMKLHFTMLWSRQGAIQIHV